MAWLPTGLTAMVVRDHGTVKPTGVRAGAGRRGHLPATTAEVRATAMPKVHRHAQVLQCVERVAQRPGRATRAPARCSDGFDEQRATTGCRLPWRLLRLHTA